MARAWLINSRGIAGKIKNATRLSNYQIKDLGVEAYRECPNCKYHIDNSDVSLEWPGLPAGVKFDPTDVELLEHLAGKVGTGNSKPHIFIDEFIPTLEDHQGICYAHPENLPGVKNDGSSVHFFHRISNAYATGHRKRRKINDECNKMSEERVRWHKTGKTKPVMENGIHKGWKKIMVLYKSSKKSCKPDKANWVMHQYHLGIDEEEKDGELVVAKIIYQKNVKQNDKSEAKVEPIIKDSDVSILGTCPRTPKTVAPPPPRPEKNSPQSDAQEYNPEVLTQKELHPEVQKQKLAARQMDEGVNSLWLAGDSQAVEELEESLLCHEVLDKIAPANDSSFDIVYPDLDARRTEIVDRNINAVCMFPELDNIHMDTPPDFHLADLQFGSQDSITSWLDRL